MAHNENSWLRRFLESRGIVVYLLIGLVWIGALVKYLFG